jgi:hypothetical protein
LNSVFVGFHSEIHPAPEAGGVSWAFGRSAAELQRSGVVCSPRAQSLRHASSFCHSCSSDLHPCPAACSERISLCGAISRKYCREVEIDGKSDFRILPGGEATVDLLAFIQKPPSINDE